MISRRRLISAFRFAAQSAQPTGTLHPPSTWTMILSTGLTMLQAASPFFIVDDLEATLAFYQSKLGFEVRHKGGGDGVGPDFWAMVGRDKVMIMLKAITPEIHPQPNPSRHEWARWDAYIYTDDPDSLYQEFKGRNVPMHRELANTEDGLRAFELADNNGYVLCFGRPADK